MGSTPNIQARFEFSLIIYGPTLVSHKTMDSESTGASPTIPPVKSHIPDDWTTRDQSANSNRHRRPRRLMLFVLVLFAVALAIQYGPHEIANWHLATALEKGIVGDPEGAEEALEAALRWDPDHHELYLVRSRQRRDTKDFEGSLEAATRAIELAPNDPDCYRLRSEIYSRMRQFPEAIADQNQIVQFFRLAGSAASLRPSKKFDLHQALNSRAYFRALGNLELKGALCDVEEAISLLGDEDQAFARASYLDTRGYIHYLLDDIEAAEKDLTLTKDIIEGVHAVTIDRLRDSATDSNSEESVTTFLNHTMAVIYHHLGLVLQKKGDVEKGQVYLELGNELGYDPEEGVW